MEQLLEQVSNHLSFLGYSTESIEPKDQTSKKLVIAKHPSKYNIMLLEMAPNFVLFKSVVTTTKPPSKEADAFINEANKLFTISRVYSEVEDGNLALKFEAVYLGEYVKDLFGTFVGMYEADQNTFHKMDHFREIFLAE